MALNGTELLIVAHLIGRAAPRPRVLALGYPDLLIRPSFVAKYLPMLNLDAIKGREDAAQICLAHNFPAETIFDAYSFFEQLGTSFSVVDFTDLGHFENVLDLNTPIPEAFRSQYDLIIDGGTIEHCFNIGQAMANVVAMLKVGGFVYHQDAILFCNHGFFSLSPTFFVDFYAQNRFEVGQPYQWGPYEGMDHDGIVKPLIPIDHIRERIDFPVSRLIGSYVAQKREDVRVTWPIQYKYGNPSSHDLRFANFIEAALADFGVIKDDRPRS